MIRIAFPTVRASLCLCLWFACAVGSSQAAPVDALTEVQRLSTSGESAAALQKADEFLATKPTDAAMRFAKGVLLADAQRRPEAIELFRGLTETHPDLAEPYNNLAALYAASGDYGLARNTLEQALRTNPTYALAHENLGDIYAMLASQSYAQALKLAPRNTSVPPKLALVRELFKRGPLTAATSAASSATP